LKKRWRSILLILVILLVIGSFIHPFGNVKAVRSDHPLLQGLNIPPDVSSVIRRSCADCHSEQTVWPLYSYVAPSSWLVESDVAGGRSHLNMSLWETLSSDDRQQALSKVASMVRNRKMPLSQYLLIHRDAKLSDAEVDLIYNWARAERKRLSASDDQAAPSTPAK
jgi:cytochrome c